MTKRPLIVATMLCGAIAAIVLTTKLISPGDPAATYRIAMTEDHEGAGDESHTHPTSGAMASMQWLAQQRAYPNDRYPRRGWVEAWEYSRRTLRRPANKSTVPWTPIGPKNIGGRTLAIAFNPENPQTVWAGSASGGLWRSFTGGVGETAWHRVPTGYPVLGVSAIAIAPGDSTLMYIGTGEVYSYDNTQGGLTDRLTRGSFGMGILKSIDGGQSWFHSLDWTYDQGRGVQVVKMAPDNPDIVWAGTTEGVFKSVDAGATWHHVHEVVMTTDLLIHATDPDIVVAACGNLNSEEPGLYRTDNGGQTWVELINAMVIPPNYGGKALLAASPSDPDVMMASIGNGGISHYAHWLIRSEDAGVTWFNVSYFDYSKWQGWFSHDVAIHPTDPWHVVTCGLDIHRVYEQGPAMQTLTDWRESYFGQVPVGGPEGPANYSHADHHDIVWHPTDPNTIYFANDGGIFRTIDGGASFQGCNGGYQTTQFYAGFSSSPTDRHHTMGGMQDNYSALYDGTDAWIRVVGGDGAWTAIDPVDEDVVYASAQYLYLFKSVNRGQDWVEITPTPMIGSPGFIAPYAIAGPDHPETIYAGTTILIRSTDGGDSFHYRRSLGGNPALALAVSPADDRYLAVTTAPYYTRSRVFVSTNGADSILEVTGDLPNRYPVGLAFAPDDPLVFYVTFSGFGTGHVYGTDDSGQTWNNLTGDLPDVPTSSILVDPLYPDHLYVGNDFGVYVSLDRGQTWNTYTEGMPEAAICMDLSTCDDERLLRVSTYGNGVWERPLLSGAPTGVDDTVPSRTLLQVDSNYPNPFNPHTTIPFTLTRDAHVTATVLTLRGEHVTTLLREMRPGGDHVIHWNGVSDAGRPQPTGVYLCRIAAGNQARTVKMQLVR